MVVVNLPYVKRYVIVYTNLSHIYNLCILLFTCICVLHQYELFCTKITILTTFTVLTRHSNSCRLLQNKTKQAVNSKHNKLLNFSE